MRSNTAWKRIWSVSAVLLLVLAVFFGCDTGGSADTPVAMHQLNIQSYESVTLEIGDSLRLTTDAPEAAKDQLVWTSSSPCVGITQEGEIIAQATGNATVTVSYYSLSDTVTVTVVEKIPDDTRNETEDKPETQPEDETQEETAPTVTVPEETLPDPETESHPETEPMPEVPPTPETDPVVETEAEPETETEYVPPTVIIEAERSPAGYQPAGSYEEALNRTQNGQLSGYPYVPDQAPILSEYRPMENGKYIKNNDPYYIDENTYVVVDAYGREVFRIYRGGAYITLEEVAAYVWAFGDIPANHSTSKSTRPTQSIWGEYLRVNHTKFSGSTSKYPYEPELPRISGCGGDLTYYEMDIGTTGTDCDPSYRAALYNDGYSITRGAARIVYARFDRNGNNIIDSDEKYVFYTYNHYNDFQEYLNYYGGWGEMFGNITGGGTISSKYDCNPTPYVPVVNAPLTARNARILPMLCMEPVAAPKKIEATLLHCDFHRYRDMAA